MTAILLFFFLLTRWIWIKDAPEGGGGGCMGIVIAVGLSVVAEGFMHKDIDGDGKIGWTWTEEVLNSKGLKPNVPYWGQMRIRTTASETTYDIVPFSVYLKEDNTFCGYHNMYRRLYFTEDIGSWDYWLDPEGNVYRHLTFENSSENPTTDIYVDKDFNIILYSIYEDDHFSKDNIVGHLQTKPGYCPDPTPVPGRSGPVWR